MARERCPADGEFRVVAPLDLAVLQPEVAGRISGNGLRGNAMGNLLSDTSRSTRAALVSLALVAAGTVGTLASPTMASALSSAAASDATPDGALATARSTGQPQVVTSLTTPTDQVVAQPGGDFVDTTSILPTRASVNGTWVPVDTTLAQQSNGTWTPAATAYGTVAFSNGGTGPLATMNSQGTSLSFTWPTALPTPTQSGSVLTYASVMPGVDLQVFANGAGGFSDVLVVHSAAAANDPGLSNLSLGISGSGVTVTTNPDGTAQATTANGQHVYDSGVAQMWDSTSTPPSSTGLSGAITASPSVVPDYPTDSSPGVFSNQAPIGLSVKGGSEHLAPNTSLLNSSSTKFPVYIDPTWSPNYASASKPAFDEVKQGCPTVSEYDNTSSLGDYGQLGVGYNGFSGCIGNEATYYQFTFPSAAKGAKIVSSTLNTSEVYSATCSTTKYTVDATSTGSISSGTDWNNHPGGNSAYNTSQLVGPAEGVNPGTGAVQCSGVSNPAVGFSATAAAAHVESVNGSTITFELYQASNASDVAFKRFSDNPTLTVEYDHAPAIPAASQISMVSGSTNDACTSASPYPYMGKTAATYPPQLHSVVKDPDADTMAATFEYWNTATPTTTAEIASANTASGGTASVTLPSSFISGLSATGATVAYRVTVTDGYLWSGWSVTCYVTIDKTAPDAPTVSSTDYPMASTSGSTVGAPAGTTGSFTLTSSNSATKFIYSMDIAPPTSNPPAADIATATNGSATLSLAPPIYGLNTLYVYAEDAAGNLAGPTDYQFLTAHTAAGAPYSSLVSAYNNQAISPDSAPTDGNFGDGYSFSATDLANAGWTSGGHVTVDGATLTLPSFGSANEPDNVEAANQTIQTSDPQDATTGQYANGLVILGFGVDSGYSSPSTPPPDTAAPYVPGGIKLAGSCPDITGQNCLPSGTLNYANSTVDYSLEIRDWALGSNADSVIRGTKLNIGTGKTTSLLPSIYAVTIPLDSTQNLQSITLPDLTTALSSAGVPSLHIVAMGFRNTGVGAPSGQTWTGSWAEPVEKTVTGGTNYTIREAIRPTLSGNTVRIKLSNSMGTAPLTVSHVSIATASGSYTSGATSGTPTALTFNSQASITIPEGGEAYSDPLPFTVTAGATPSWVDVSYAITNTSAVLPAHSLAGDVYTLVSANGSGDHTGDSAGSAFTPASAPGTSDLLTGLDIATSNLTPTVAILGDQLTSPNATGSTAQTTPGTPNLADDLSTDCVNTPCGYNSTTQTATNNSPGFVNEGIEANLLGTDAASTSNGGPSVLTRLDRDVLDQPNIGTVVITQGLQDLLNQTDELAIEADYIDLQQQLAAFGINVVFTTLTPCGGNSACTSAIESTSGGTLNDINNFMPQSTYIAPSYGSPTQVQEDLASTVGDQGNPPALLNTSTQKYDSGDHLNLSQAGYQAEANWIVGLTQPPGTLAPFYPNTQ